MKYTALRTQRRLLWITGIVLLVIAVVVLSWQIWLRPAKKVDSFAACAAAGNTVEQGYPRICTTKDGQQFTDPPSNFKMSPPLQSAP